MSRFKTKPLITIKELIRLTRDGKMVWKFERSQNDEKLRCSYKITTNKFIGCEIIKFRNGSNYFIRFYYKGKELTTYYYQHIPQVFDLFIYAKYVSYIMEIGNDSFVDVMCNHFDNYEWESSFKGFMYSTKLESIDKKYGGIDVAKGNIEIVINDDLLYNINDTRLYKLLDSYDDEDVVIHNENIVINYTDYKPDVINNNKLIVRYTQNFLDKNKVNNIKKIINKQWLSNNPVAFEVFNNKLYLTEGHHRFEAALQLSDNELLRTLFNTAIYHQVKRKPKSYKRKRINLLESIDWEFEEDFEEEIPDNWVPIPFGVTLKVGDKVRINPKSIFRDQGFDKNNQPMTAEIVKVINNGQYKYETRWIEINYTGKLYNNRDLLYNP